MSTAIEWADVAHNVVHGCSRASAGCDHCYAARMDGTRIQGQRFTDASGQKRVMRELIKIFPGKPKLGKRGQPLKAREPARYAYNGQVYLDPAALQAALDLPRTHKGKTGYSVFWNFRSDTFHESLTNEEIAAQFGVMATRPDLQFLVLTKRAKRMREWFEREGVAADVGAAAQSMGVKPSSATKVYPVGPGGEFGERWFIPWHLPNVRLGVSVENQETADERIPELMATPAAGHFVSLEPMLGPVRISEWIIPRWRRGEIIGDGVEALEDDQRNKLSWLIVGAESGPNARPAELDWVRSVRDQVLAARDGRAVPMTDDPHLFIKQWDVCEQCTAGLLVRCDCDGGVECGVCGGTGLAVCDCQYGDAGMGRAGKVRKGNPALDGRSWAEVPK